MWLGISFCINSSCSLLSSVHFLNTRHETRLFLLLSSHVMKYTILSLLLSPGFSSSAVLAQVLHLLAPSGIPQTDWMNCSHQQWSPSVLSDSIFFFFLIPFNENGCIPTQPIGGLSSEDSDSFTLCWEGSVQAHEMLLTSLTTPRILIRNVFSKKQGQKIERD